MRIIHDVWSIDKYGKKWKITYIKCLCDREGKPVIASKEGEPEGRFYESRRRARATVYELALCNEFSFFCTFTQNGEIRDRYDLDGFVKDFAQYVRNLNRRREEGDKIRYLLVPEQHKDGAWHLHGLLQGLRVGCDLVPNEHGYLDWAGYRSRFGFFSCSEIRDKGACSAYISKYVTKSFEDEDTLARGRHLYYASQGLARRERVVDKEATECPCSRWDFENDYVKVRWVDDLGDL